MINSSGWTFNTLIPQTVRDLIGTLGTDTSAHVDPGAMQVRNDQIAEGYRTAPVRPLPMFQAPVPQKPAGPPTSTPATAALLAKVFGGTPPPVNNFSTGNFAVVLPKNASPVVSTPPTPSFNPSGWVSPSLDANGFYQVPKMSVPQKLFKTAYQAQPF